MIEWSNQRGGGHDADTATKDDPVITWLWLADHVTLLRTGFTTGPVVRVLA